MWNNVVEPGRLQMTIWRMRIAYWIPKATDTNSEYVLLVCFPTAKMVTRTFPFLLISALVRGARSAWPGSFILCTLWGCERREKGGKYCASTKSRPPPPYTPHPLDPLARSRCCSERPSCPGSSIKHLHIINVRRILVTWPLLRLGLPMWSLTLPVFRQEFIYFFFLSISGSHSYCMLHQRRPGYPSRPKYPYTNHAIKCSTVDGTAHALPC